jgi:hypothetical protein
MLITREAFELLQKFALVGLIAMRSVRMLLLGLILANCAALFGQTRAIETHLAVLSSSDVPSLTKQRVGSCLQQLLQAWKLNEANLPNIVVFQASRETAVTAGRKESRRKEEQFTGRGHRILRSVARGGA